MTGPTRATLAGRVYLDLQNKARRERRATDELLQLYALEGFLARLSASPHAAKLVLKGGVLLAAFGNRRPTRDIDFAAQQLSDDMDAMLDLVQQVASIDIDDGLIMHGSDASAEVIRDDEEYPSVRVTLGAALHQARMRFHIDVNIGDPVWPAPHAVGVPRLLGGDLIRLSGYPLHMVHAEKIVTAVQRGTANTRWRDFGDVWTLSGAHPVEGSDLVRAVTEVANHRRVEPQSLNAVLAGFADLAQQRYAVWRTKHRMDDLPHDFADVLAGVTGFADPALSGAAGSKTWDPRGRLWL
ncbi:MAG TPA: nucleotidyl transferase AbiEii/AbiGii toxin family protein [Nocardioidaceae bacterium]|nr:nucleotidyl transferase AbiEii/AbiGii toxin family protein [Nocardioidaceae bacterium]